MIFMNSFHLFSKYSILLILLVIISNRVLLSQTPIGSVNYSYDLNGNRIHRWVTVLKLQQDSSTIQKDSATKAIHDAEVRHLKDEVAIYPNPTMGILDVKITGMKAGETSQCVFYALSGKELLRKELSGTISRVDINSFPPGTYIVSLILYDGRVEKWKVGKF